MDEHSKDISEAEAFAKKYCNPEDSDIISDLDLHARKTAWALLQRIKHLEKKSCVCEECGSEVEEETVTEEITEETIENPVITKDNAERTEAQAIVDATPQAVIDTYNGE